MSSTYSTNLAIELIGTGDQAGSWGNTTNTNLGTLVEQAISGYVTQAVSTGTDTTITIPNGATGVARNMYIELTGTGGTNTNLIVPSNKKLYFIFNNSTGAVTVKVSGQTGVSVPQGKKVVLTSNGTDIVNGLNYIADFGSNSATITQLTATSATITNLTLTSLVISNLSIASANITTLTSASATITNLLGTTLTISGNSFLATSSGNVGIGTASPNCKFEVKGGSAISTLSNSYTNAGILHQYSSSILLAIGSDGTNPVLQGVNATNNTAKDITLQPLGGNLGLGVTPSAWSLLKGLQTVGGGFFGSNANSTFVGANWYYDGANKYIANGYASRYITENGAHAWYTAASGTAGNTISFTQAMTLDASSNLSVATTSTYSAYAKLHVLNGIVTATNATDGGVYIGATTGGTELAYLSMGRSYNLASTGEIALATSGAKAILFGTNNTERARITAGGDLLVGTTTANYTASGRGLIEVNGSTDAFYGFKTGGTARGYIAHSGTNLALVNSVTNGSMEFSTNNIERMRIDGGGGVKIGASNAGGTMLGISDGATDATSYGAVQVTKAADHDNKWHYACIQAGQEIAGMGFQDNVSQMFVVGRGGDPGSTNCIRFAGSDSSTHFLTNGSERARITGGGYFKASATGTYRNPTGPFNEFYSTVSDDHVLAVSAINNAYSQAGGGILFLNTSRSASSSYVFGGWYSGDAADKEFEFRGDGNGYADGTWNNNGADYAEYFESATGGALTVGATVVLDGNKVREATASDPVSAIMGVVRPKEPSKASMVVGNTAWNKWANKYLTDDFDRYIMEDHDVVEWTDEDGKQHSYESHNIPAGVTVPADAVRKTHDEKGNKFQHYKLNPAWDKDAEYTPREKRDEWIIVGLVGQVKVLKGKPVNDRWIKMRDVSAAVEEWMIR